LEAHAFGLLGEEGKMGKRAWTALWILALLTGSIACNGEQPQPPAVDESVGTLLVESDAFEAEGTIPQLYTCDGDDISPSLRWSEPPAGTQSLALIFDDVDAPVRTWVHWVIFNIAADARSLPEGVPADPSVAGLGVHGSNSWGRLGYGGPCPPKGGPHRYTFRLYALDTVLDLDAGASRAELDTAMEGHILSTGQLMGRYGR
jgi:Raf kinase inhibitor-like YbhB/YbcL family protein